MNRKDASNKINNFMRKTLRAPYAVFNSYYRNSSCEKGKKLRSGLFLSFANRLDDEAVKIAASIELVHLASLIHDDVLDGAALRRGRAPLYKNSGTKESILYGDYLFAKSFLILTKIRNKEVWSQMNKALSEVIEGEILQQSREGDIDLKKKEYLEIIGKKTAELFASSCEVGAMIKRGKKIPLKDAQEFGYNLGMAYQIYDDCNDYFGITGKKKKLSDIGNRVVTLPVINLLEGSTKKEKEEIRKIFKKKKPNNKEIEKMVDMMYSKNTLEKSILEGAKYFDVAKNIYEKKFKTVESNGLKKTIDEIGEKIHEFEKYCNNRRRIRRT